MVITTNLFLGNRMSKSNSKTIELYEKYYIDRDYEQVDLFRLLKKGFNINSAIYAGSYVHISPAFIFPKTVFIDADKKAKKFFEDESALQYITDRKEYLANPDVKFYAQDYRTVIDALESQFDLLISQYAGFISDSCKSYLKVGGHLLVNNSHGDAGLASIDNDYELVATIHKSKGKYRISSSNLGEYFIPKKNINVTKEYLYETGKGVGYTKTATLYVFIRKS